MGLHESAKAGKHIDLRSFLTKDNANELDYLNRTPLNCAAEFGIEREDVYIIRPRNSEVNHNLVMKSLLEQNADPNLSDNKGNAPLHTIAGIYNPFMSTTTGPCCHLLIERGAKIDLPNKDGDTPLMILPL